VKLQHKKLIKSIFLLFLKGKQVLGSVFKRKAWSVYVCICLYNCNLVYESISVNIMHWYLELTLIWVSAKLSTSLRDMHVHFWFSPISIIPLMFCIHILFIYHWRNVILAVNNIIKKITSYMCPLLSLWCINLCSWNSLVTSKDQLFIVTFIIFWRHMYSEQTHTHT